MCFHYDLTNEFDSLSWVKAKTQHQCYACNLIIEAKDLCEYAAGKCDGYFFSYYLCGSCCLTTYRIHLHEIIEGCREWQSWCPVDELHDYCRETNFERSTHHEGQRFIDWKREAKNLKRDAKIMKARVTS